jgi:V8-like Glu-specific endopeptidase
MAKRKFRKFTNHEQRALRLDELLQAQPIIATESAPELLQDIQEGVRYGQTRERSEYREIQRELSTVQIPSGYRPPWRSMNYVPRLLPPQVAMQSSRFHDNILSYPLALQLLRSELFDESYPWGTVGKLFAGSDTMGSRVRVCSGVLVGPNLLLTASHCVPWDGNNWWMRFIPAYSDRNLAPGSTYRAPYGESYVSDFYGFRNTDEVTGLDYAICRLYTRLGENAGWMGSQSYGEDDPYEDGSWNSVGYPTNFFGGHRPAVEFGVQVDDIDNEGDGREIETRIYTADGWSGGPLWGWIAGDAKVIGVLSGAEKDFLDPTRDVYAGGSPMVDLVKFGFANWP